MLNKLLPLLVFMTLFGCSESSESPVLSQASDSTAESSAGPSQALGTLTIWVAAEKRQCMAVGPTECLQIRLSPDEDWQLFYGEIVGFDYQPGQLYQIEVSEVLIPDPPADAPDRQWVLRQVIHSYSE